MSAAAIKTPNELTTSQWVFSEKLSAEAGIEMDMITEAFKRSGIPHEVAEFPLKDREIVDIKVEPQVDLFSNPAEAVWENGSTQVVIVNENQRSHLLFRPKGDVKYADVSNAQYLALRNKMKVIPDVFEKVFGFADYCEQLLESKDTFGFEIFPGFAEKEGVVDLLDKDVRNLYLLTRGRYESYSVPADKLENLRKELVAALNGTNCLTQRSFVRKREEVKINAALRYRVNAFARLMKDQGASLALVKSSRNEPTKAEEKEDSRPHITTRCLFSNPPDKEIVYKDKIVQIILNPKPYVGLKEPETKHVMVVPTRHVEDCTNVNDNELLAERQAILNLRMEWEKLYPDHEMFVWKQQGIKAGQTVPHLHTQVLCAKVSQIWEYYRLMIKDIIKVQPLEFAANVQLKQGLKDAVWT